MHWPAPGLPGLFASLLASCPCIQALSGPIRLVADVNEVAVESSSSSYPTLVADLGSRWLFAARDAERGTELWETDGTVSGTKFFYEFTPGPGGDYIGSAYGPLVTGRFVFQAASPGHGREWWSTDGTPQGTQRISELGGGDLDAPITGSLVHNGVLYFWVKQFPGSAGSDLWRSDGTEAGTTFVTSKPAAIGTWIGASMYYGLGNRGVWKTDLTDAGTQQVAVLPSGQEAFKVAPTSSGIVAMGASSSADFGDMYLLGNGTGTRVYSTSGFSFAKRYLFPLNGWVFALSPLGSGLLELNWNRGVSGTGNAYYLTDVFIGMSNSGYEPGSFFDSFGGVLVFAGYKTINSQYQLYRIGSAFNSVTAITNTPGGFRAYRSASTFFPNVSANATVLNGNLLFTARTQTQGDELWSLNPSFTSLSLLADVFPGAGSSVESSIGFSTYLATVGSQVFWISNDGVHGKELWATGGTPETTRLVKDVLPGAGGQNSSAFSAGGLCFASLSDGATGYEPWVSDGTEGGTIRLRDIMPQVSDSSTPSPAVACGDQLVVLANDGAQGVEPVGINPITGDFDVLADTTPGPSFGAANLTSLDSQRALFTTTTGGSKLWITDGSIGGTQTVAAFTGGPYSPLVPVRNGVMVFSASDPVHGAELWRSDGSGGGTYRLTDIAPNSASSSPSSITIMGGKAYFLAFNAGAGAVYSADPDAPGAVKVLDLPVPVAGSPSLTGMVSLGNMLLIATSDGTLWRSLGTASTTTPIYSFAATNGLTSARFSALPTAAVFFANDGVHGTQLWSSNGTTATVLTNASGGLTSIQVFPAAERMFFFATSSDPGGSALRVTDGTSAGTQVVRGSLSAKAGIVAGHDFYFSATDTSSSFNDFELWRSDGTESGTVQIADLYPGTANGSDPRSFALLGSKLYFTAMDNTVGAELRVLDLSSSCPADLNSDSLVDDSDFVLFLPAYNILDCADPAMSPGCPSDLNADFLVDDSDFIIFVVAYNALLCP